MNGLRKIMSLTTVFVIVLLFSTVAFASNGEFKLGGDIHITENQTKNGDIVAIGGNVTIDGTVNGDVVAIGGNVTLRGRVNGDVVIVGGELTMSEEAAITGEKIEIGTGSLSLSDLSGITNINFTFYNRTAWSITALVVNILLSLLVVVIMPKSIENMADYLPQKGGKVALVGLLTVLAFPVLLIISLLAILILIGIMLTPLLILLYVVMAFLGSVAVSVFIGKRLSKLIDRESLNLPIKMIIGLVVLWGAKQVPFIGGWISFAMIFVTLGLVVASRFGKVDLNPTNPPADVI